MIYFKITVIIVLLASFIAISSGTPVSSREVQKQTEAVHGQIAASHNNEGGNNNRGGYNNGRGNNNDRHNNGRDSNNDRYNNGQK